MSRSPRRDTAAGDAPRAQTEDLVARCVAGDDAAKAAFIGEYGDLIQRAVAGKLAALGAQPPIRADVEDIRNDILARLLADDCAMLQRLRAPRSLNAWLVTVARNHVVDYLRKWSARMRAQERMIRQENRGAHCPAASTARSPAETAMAREAAAQLRQGIDALPAPERLVIELFFTQHLRYAEIADITGESINTVAARLRRAKAKLRRWIEAAETALCCGHEEPR